MTRLPWLIQFYAQDEASFAQYLHTLQHYIQPRAQGTAFTDFYLRFFAHHLSAIARPGGLFEDTVVTRLPWRGQMRRVRMVVYRRINPQTSRRNQTPEQALNVVCDRLMGGLSNAGITAQRMDAAAIHDAPCWAVIPPFLAFSRSRKAMRPWPAAVLG